MKKKKNWTSAALMAVSALSKLLDDKNKNYDATCAYMAALEDEINRRELKDSSCTEPRQEYISKKFNEIKSRNLKIEELMEEKKNLEKRYNEADS